jgi:hypothetical protein
MNSANSEFGFSIINVLVLRRIVSFVYSALLRSTKAHTRAWRPEKLLLKYHRIMLFKHNGYTSWFALQGLPGSYSIMCLSADFGLRFVPKYHSSLLSDSTRWFLGWAPRDAFSSLTKIVFVRNLLYLILDWVQIRDWGWAFWISWDTGWEQILWDAGRRHLSCLIFQLWPGLLLSGPINF